MSRPDLDAELRLLISFGSNLPKMLLLIKEGADVNTQNLKGDTALHSVCTRGKYGVAELLELGADVNIQDYDLLFSPIMSASANNYHENVKALIDAKADINLRSSSGRTAFSIACENGCTDIVKSLLCAGTGIDSMDDAGNTPLIHATTRGQVGVVRFLVNQGADIGAVNHNGYRAMDFLACNAIENILEKAVTEREVESSLSRESCVSHIFKQSR